MAKPPLSYESALRWSDETVKSEIPSDLRIYILGPEKVTETYQLDNKPATHDVEVRRAIQVTVGLTLGHALKNMSMENSKDFNVAVYRKLDSSTLNTSTPLYCAEGKQAMSSTLLLQARDVISLNYPPLRITGKPLLNQ